MAEVLVSSDNLSVLGGPSSITLNLDTGAPGQRGTFILYGFPNPNSSEAQETFISEPQVFDFYVVVDPGSEDYLQLYQYVNQDGELIWIPAVKLSINIYSTTRPMTFINGVSEIEINVSDLGLAGVEQTGQSQSIDLNFFSQPGSAAYFNVQMSISNFNPEYVINPTGGETLDLYPVIFTYIISDVYLNESSGQLRLPITISAAEVTPLGVVPVNDKNLFVQMLITLQNPQQIINFLTELILGGNS
jgi:hypothetical protein